MSFENPFLKKTVSEVVRSTKTKIALMAAALAAAHPAYDAYENNFNTAEVKRDIMSHIAYLHMRYDMGVSLPGFFEREKSDFSYTDMRRSLRWAIDELAAYPDDLVKKNIREIEIGTFGNTRDSENFGEGGQAVVSINVHGSVPSMFEGTVFKLVLHHEIFHCLDDMDNPQWEKQWATHNPSGTHYRYGQGEEETANRDHDHIFDRKELLTPDGFVFHYQSKNSLEDRAVIAEIIMGAPKPFQKAIIGLDPYMQGKVDEIKAYLVKKSDGKMDKSYWKDYENGNADVTYWLEKDSDEEKK